MDLEKTAIKRIQSASEMALNHYGKPLLVTDSGGKDSAVCRELVRRSGVPHEIIHNLTTADAPQTVLYIRERFREAEAAGIPCEIQYPYYKGKRVTMWSLIPQKKIPPTRLARYCCEVLKEGSGVGRFITTGVRWAESQKRKTGRGIYEAFDRNQAKKLILNNDNDDRRQLFESCRVRSKHICNPIVDWSDREVWDYIRSEKIPINPLYEMGFYRVAGRISVLRQLSLYMQAYGIKCYVPRNFTRKSNRSLVPYKDKYNQYMEELVDYTFDMLLEEKKMCSTNIVLGVITRIISQASQKAICPAGVNTFSVSHDNKISPCFMYTSKDDISYGNIGDDPDEILSRAYTFDEYINNKDKVDECQECFARNVCSSCLGSFEIKSDKVQISNPIYCESIKVATKRALQRLSDIKKNPKTWEEFNRFLDKGYEERR